MPMIGPSVQFPLILVTIMEITNTYFTFDDVIVSFNSECYYLHLISNNKLDEKSVNYTNKKCMSNVPTHHH